MKLTEVTLNHMGDGKRHKRAKTRAGMPERFSMAIEALSLNIDVSGQFRKLLFDRCDADVAAAAFAAIAANGKEAEIRLEDRICPQNVNMQSLPWWTHNSPCHGSLTHSLTHSTPLHSTPLHSTPLHSTPLHSTPLHSTPLHSTPLHSTPLHSTPLHSTPLHSTPLHSTPLHSTPLHSTPLHSTPLHSTSLTHSLTHSLSTTAQDRLY